MILSTVTGGGGGAVEVSLALSGLEVVGTWGFVGQSLAMCPNPPQYKHRPSAILLARSSGVIRRRLADKSIGPGAVPTAVVELDTAAGVGVLVAGVVRAVLVVELRECVKLPKREPVSRLSIRRRLSRR